MTLTPSLTSAHVATVHVILERMTGWGWISAMLQQGMKVAPPSACRARAVMIWWSWLMYSMEACPSYLQQCPSTLTFIYCFNSMKKNHAEENKTANM